MIKKISGCPANIEESIDDLKAFYRKDLDILSMMTENQFISSSKFTEEMCIRTAWCLWWYENHQHSRWPKKKPELVNFFNKLGIYDCDEMCSIILTSFYRSVAGDPINLAAQLKLYTSSLCEI
jgi:hypothetical protein